MKFLRLALLTFVVVLATGVLIGCGDETEVDCPEECENCVAQEEAMANLEANKEVALNLSRAIMNGEWDKVDELISEDFTYVGDGGDPIGKEQYIGFMRGVLSSAMTDMDMDFTRVIAEGDQVAVEYTNAMTHSGEFYGVSATGISSERLKTERSSPNGRRRMLWV